MLGRGEVSAVSRLIGFAVVGLDGPLMMRYGNVGTAAVSSFIKLASMSQWRVAAAGAQRLDLVEGVDSTDCTLGWLG